jgi:cytochrome b pre-mRNA-processing protein 3
MILNLFRRTSRDDTIAILYGAIVAQARVPAFYRLYGIADTANGRLEMIILHAILVVSRLEKEGGPVRSLGQGLFDHFCDDMDANLREMAVGDMAVPRKMKAIAESFYGRKRAYEAALAAPELDQLVAALVRNIHGGDAVAPPEVERLAAYVRDAVRNLATIDAPALLRGAIAFPDPEAIPTPAPKDARSGAPMGVP